MYVRNLHIIYSKFEDKDKINEHMKQNDLKFQQFQKTWRGDAAT